MAPLELDDYRLASQAVEEGLGVEGHSSGHLYFIVCLSENNKWSSYLKTKLVDKNCVDIIITN